ncbi:ribosome small subunit-dependent GTPase A [Sinosporangium siamense]|uniref:Small ribosomal subunit biogenesis GTPase RsgA n=1 Tax=Sinosporangium siamense TaxID=1367973 RepID=A0A919REE1_9ACTN|nr:ribosome small subunit-dependent GTPase A [Sinosporangium siamense]GII92078.1 putative ribosome biogenesis GTPase RsgA [Sinosporangium siamense]
MSSPGDAGVFDLSLLGWTDSLAADLPAGSVPGRIAQVHRGAAEVITAEGRRQARYSAKVRRAAAADPVMLPCVGDWAAVRLVVPEGRYELDGVLPRRTAFVRGGVSRDVRGGLSGDGQGQVLAANVDVVFVAEPSMHGTDLADLGRVERLVTLAWESGARPVVLVTKADMLTLGLHDLIKDVEGVVPGVPVHAVSSLRGQGVEIVRDYLGTSATAVVLGTSGAGKSTLVNALAGREAMETQQVRAGDGRGRHTTVHRELIPLPGGGLIIDTPGIRRVGLYEIGDGVERVFADVEDLARLCRFDDCAHNGEPGCAVLEALQSGALPERRYESWRKLQREAAWMARRTDARLRSEEQRKWKTIHKEMRKSGRNRP